MSISKNSPSSLVGGHIRKIRNNKRISLEEMRNGTGLSISFLSQLENGKANISLDNIKKIADFLDVQMARFFEDEADAAQLGAVTLRGDGIKVTLNDTTAYCESLIRKGGVNLQASLYISPPGEGRKNPFSHNGEEFVYVLEGEILFYLNDEKYHLKVGDSMYYRGEVLHSFSNPTQFQNKIIIINTPQHWESNTSKNGSAVKMIKSQTIKKEK
ncbi:cupin domain-containing protein [Desulfobacula sp.]|uniref:helix-turn-helix domain-containing protein n=1 Tax=Desulfobacula sp. TaxID=2593537 RepID=UPI0026019006|nr:cupin domain-containing protein [Desulfobacula sp.]